MCLSQSAWAMKSLDLYFVVYISLVFGTSQALSDFSKDSCVFKMTLRHFRVILSWELRKHSIVPTHYTLWYTIMRQEDLEVVKDCINITTSFCDVTHVWKNMSETYIPVLHMFQGNTRLVSCPSEKGIVPLLNMSWEPSDFEIVAFPDHIKVIVKFPPVIPKILYGKGSYMYLPLVIEEESEGLVKKHRPKINAETIHENFSYDINNLIPNTNYCVSVYFEHNNMENTINLATKCTLLQPGQQSESSDSAKIGGVVTTFFIVAVIVSTVVLLKQIGCICLRNKFPKVLDFYNFSAWVFPELPSSEEMTKLEVILVNRKKKVWDYNYDESDSDDETDPRTSGGGYTMHGLTGRPLCPASASLATLEDCSNPDVEETDLLEPETTSESPVTLGPGPRQPECTSEVYTGRGALPEVYTGRGALPEGPFSEKDSSSTEGSEDRSVFNVDLNSVSVRVLDDDPEVHSLLSLPEDTAEFEDPNEMETNLLVASGGRTQPSFPSPSVECLWSEDSLSEKSDTSEPGVDIRDGYIMR